MYTDIKNIKVGLMYEGDNQLAIKCDCIEHFYNWEEHKMVARERPFNFNNLYQIEFYSMYHNLAKECNRLFGTEFAFSQEFIDKVKFKKHSEYNISYEYDWAITNGGKEIEHRYWYEGHSKTFIGLGGICTATYGDWDKDSIIALVTALKDAIEYGSLDEIIYGTLKSKYEMYDELGVSYKKEEGFENSMEINKIVA